MQDFFKYDKLQRGASLFMKSDHDGDKDAQNRSFPLGIKSVAQGIEHFTNWDNISNSLLHLLLLFHKDEFHKSHHISNKHQTLL